MAAGDVYLAGTVRNASEPCVLTGAMSAEAPRATDLPFWLGACEAGSCLAGTVPSQLRYIPAQPVVVLLPHLATTTCAVEVPGGATTDLAGRPNAAASLQMVYQPPSNGSVALGQALQWMASASGGTYVAGVLGASMLVPGATCEFGLAMGAKAWFVCWCCRLLRPPPPQLNQGAGCTRMAGCGT